jgi:hypothetical protein
MNTEQSTADTYSVLAFLSLLNAAHREPNFAEWLTTVVAGVAGNLGGVDELLAGRPGSWEAAAIDTWLESAGCRMPDVLAEYRTYWHTRILDGGPQS